MKFTVIIPTRERCEYLRYALQTCVEQDYDELDIIVSDNFSQDATRDVVESFDDPRISYINTGRRVSMSSNWEFALNNIKGGYLLYLGDDDGLLPGAIGDIAGLVRDSGTPSAVKWSEATYNWPCRAIDRNEISIPMRNKLIRCPASTVLNHTLRGWVDYRFGPGLYRGFVNYEVIQRIKKRTDLFFWSICPDVYSTLAVLSDIKWYILATRPFTVAGASSRSNGHAFMASTTMDNASQEVKDFFQEIDLPVHQGIDIMPGSASSAFVEAFLQANDHCFSGKLHINIKTWLKLAFEDYATRENKDYMVGLRHIEAFGKRVGLTSFVERCKTRYPNRPAQLVDIPLGFDGYRNLRLDTAMFGASNVYDSCILTARLLGKYKRPARIASYNIMSRMAAHFHRLLSDLLMW